MNEEQIQLIRDIEMKIDVFRNIYAAHPGGDYSETIADLAEMVTELANSLEDEG